MPRATLPFFFFNDTATTEIYTLSLHDALPISPPLDLVEHLGGRTRRPVAHGRAEALEGGLVGEGGLRPKVGDGQRRLEGAAPGEDLAPDGTDGLRGERPGARGQTPEDLRLTLRRIQRRILPSFEVSDLEGGLGALVEELEDSVVEVIDPGTPIVQVHRDSHYCRALGVPRIIGRGLPKSKFSSRAAPRRRPAARSPRSRSTILIRPGGAPRGRRARTRSSGARARDGPGLRRSA